MIAHEGASNGSSKWCSISNQNSIKSIDEEVASPPHDKNEELCGKTANEIKNFFH